MLVSLLKIRDRSLFVAFKYQYKKFCCIKLVMKRQRNSSSTKIVYLGKLSEAKVNNDRKAVTFGRLLSRDQDCLI